MLNFTVGPVMSSDAVRAKGAEQVPYFRTTEFSEIMLENEALMKEFTYAEDNARTVFITGSGTAAMEAAVMNIFNSEDKLLIVDGGSFGHRFTQICDVHKIPYDTIIPEFGYGITEEQLSKFDKKGYTGFLVNIDETSRGVLYDVQMIGEFCKRNNIFLVVDAVSSFLCDELNMKKNNIQVLLTGSQKALACPPGISVIVLSALAVEKVYKQETKCFYLDLKSALENGKRGQTPFTPAVGTLLQINVRLKDIKAHGGCEYEIKRRRELAEDFRRKIEELPFEIVSHSLSNAVTPLHPLNVSANDIFLTLKDEYGIWVCPNGGDMKDTVFRVGHLGELSVSDNDVLINALKDMQKRGLL